MRNAIFKFTSVCDVLTWVKLVLGIAVIAFGIINQDLFGLIGIWPVGEFLLKAFHPKYQTSCDIPVSKSAVKKS